MVIWLIGLSGSGKTTVAKEVWLQLKARHPNTVLLDGDIVREVFRHDSDSAYTMEERKKNAERICELGLMLDRQGIHVVCAILSAFEEHRRWNREKLSEYYEVYLKVPMDTLRRREIKGLYAAALKGEITNVVGVDLPFEEPKRPDLVVNNEQDRKEFKTLASEILEGAFKKYGHR